MELLELESEQNYRAASERTHDNFGRQKVEITPSEVEVTSMDEKFCQESCEIGRGKI